MRKLLMSGIAALLTLAAVPGTASAQDVTDSVGYGDVYIYWCTDNDAVSVALYYGGGAFLGVGGPLHVCASYKSVQITGGWTLQFFGVQCWSTGCGDYSGSSTGLANGVEIGSADDWFPANMFRICAGIFDPAGLPHWTDCL